MPNTDLEDAEHNIWHIPVCSVDTWFLHEIHGAHGTKMKNLVPAMGAHCTHSWSGSSPTFSKNISTLQGDGAKKISFPIILSPCLLLASRIYCRFYYTLKYDFYAILKASPSQLQSLAVNNRRGKLNSQQFSALPFHKTNCKMIWSNNKWRMGLRGWSADMVFPSETYVWKKNRVKNLGGSDLQE